MMPDFVDLTTDFGFKRFTSNKTFVLAFLNAVIPEELISIDVLETRSARPSQQSPSIESLTHGKSQTRSSTSDTFEDFEMLSRVDNQTVILDFVCQTQSGEFINVQMQKTSQVFPVHRALYYSSRLISRHKFTSKDSNNQTWNWKISRLYHIGILDSLFEIDQIPVSYQKSWKLWFQLGINGEKSEPSLNLSNKDSFAPNLLQICLISLPQFRKMIEYQLSPTATSLHKFAWLFANLASSQLDRLPQWTRESVFKEVLEVMKMSKLMYFEFEKYEAELIRLRNKSESLHSSFQKGKEEGIEEGKELGLVKGLEKGLEQGFEAAMRKTYTSLLNTFGAEIAYKFVCETYGKENVDKMLCQ